MAKKKPKRKVLKVTRVPLEITSLPPAVPEPTLDIVTAIALGEVEEIHFAEKVEPSRWERLKKWFKHQGDE